MVDKKNNMDPRFLNAAATYNEVMASGLPAAPLEFPSPVFATANRVNASVYNPDVDEEIVVPNVIYEVRRDGQPPKRAYWIGRKLKNAIYGCVCSCSVLKVREGGWAGPDGNSIWEITPEFAAVKILDLDVIRKRQEQKDKISEDPIKEVAAMQYSSSEGSKPHVLPCWDVFLDEQYIYMVMPLCSKGELFEYVKWNGRFDESVARYWFKQLLSALISLQKHGITHRDLSLENILIDENTHALVIDLGMCLRVPFSPTALSNTPGGSSNGTLRLPLLPQGLCGKPFYISPEVLADVSFDGFAIDLWAAGVILFTMLVGVPPFSWADMDDAKFRVISQGGLGLLLKIWNRPVSPHAEHLLQSMLMYNPQDRLTLFQVMNHPWILEESSIDSNGNVANGSNNNSIIQMIERMSPPKDDDDSEESTTQSMSEEA